MRQKTKMSEEDLYIVTTSEPETVPDLSNKIVYLGDWCLEESQKSFDKNLTNKILSYHWDNRKKLLDDYTRLSETYENLLIDLSDVLNTYHQVQKSVKYWRILIGPWLLMYLHVFYDRYESIKNAFDQFKINKVIFLKHGHNDFIPNDMLDFSNDAISDLWNEHLCQKIISHLFSAHISVKYVKKLSKNKKNDEIKVNSFKQKAKLFFSGTLNKFFNSSQDKVFLYKPGVKFWIIARSQFHLGQFPRFTKNIKIPKFTVNSQLRELFSKLSAKKHYETVFEQIAFNLIPHFFPLTYLEGYKDFLKVILSENLPKNPNVICTSTSFQDDDGFKLYTAEMLEKGGRLITTQHGGHNGMTPFAPGEDHAIAISDKFLSWGWSDIQRPNVKPLGNIRYAGDRMTHNSNGPALLLTFDTTRYAYHMITLPLSSQWLYYFEYQKKFLRALPPKIRRNVLLRIKKAEFGWSVFERLKDFMPELSTEHANQHIRKSVRKSRIYICTYNATTFIEAINWNIPTLIFWDPVYFEVIDEVAEYLEKFKALGIFHTNPQSAADKLTEIWNNIDEWWFSDVVQKLRKEFLNNYSKPVDKPSIRFYEELKDLCKK